MKKVPSICTKAFGLGLISSMRLADKKDSQSVKSAWSVYQFST